MVNYELGIHSEHMVKLLLPLRMGGVEGHIAHGLHAVTLQFGSYAAANAPEIGQGAVLPQLLAVTHLVKLSYTHAVFIGLSVLGYYIHGHFGQIQVGADARGGCDAGYGEYVAYHEHGHLAGRTFAHLEIVCKVNEHLVNGIDVYVIGRNVLEVDGVYLAAHLHVTGHLGRRGNVTQGCLRIRLNLGVVSLGVTQLTAGSVEAAFPVDLAHTLYHLKQACAAGYAVTLE